ncbi:MAG: aspartate dehydrogenase [Methanomassiliicoccales archaeon]
MRLLIIGCGSIGSTLAKALDNMPEVDLIYITDKNRGCTADLVKKLRKVRSVGNTEMDLDSIAKEVNIVVEAASQEAAKHYVPFFLERGVDVMVLSVGAFADEKFRDKCFQLAREKNSRIYVPSGAITGTDGLRSASTGKIDEVILVTTKGPNSLKSVEYFKKKRIDFDAIKEPMIVFEGTAREAAANFPKNMNVAATVSLLGVGFDKTKVRIICDPRSERNRHTLIVKGSFGEITSTTENVPFPNNPSTSYLAALSAISALRRIITNIWIGI